MIEVCWTGQGTLSNSMGVGGSTDGSSNESLSLEFSKNLLMTNDFLNSFFSAQI